MMDLKFTRRGLLVLAIPALLPGQDDFAVITQVANPRTIGKAQIKKLILGQEAFWTGGGKATLLLGPAGDGPRAAALKYFAGISDLELSKIVMRLSFTGHPELAPVTLMSQMAVFHTVQAKPGTVGIVPVSAVNDSVKKLEVE